MENQRFYKPKRTVVRFLIEGAYFCTTCSKYPISELKILE